ncbi:MAG: polysaccharide deacetylase family protein, partial [Gemmatimonadetes bacterium]|nr:polysaccharide deacetylase family protein [Gemmatimonadota bacterium]
MNGGTLGTIGARITCRWTDSIIGCLPTSERQIFLTIDDGPTDQSERLADILQPHGVNATWFLVGISAER